jgi:hypothetical protein
MSDHLKSCGRPHICQRACAFAAAEQHRAFSRYLADHAHNPQVETGVTPPIGGEIRSSTLFRVLGKMPDAAHYGELLRDATFAGGAPVDPPKAVNPKDGIGNTKLPLHLWPFSATAQGSLALLDGMLKYGRLNWRGPKSGLLSMSAPCCGMSRNGSRVRTWMPKAGCARWRTVWPASPSFWMHKPPAS